MGRTARGVKAISLAENDCVAGMVILQPGTLVLTVSETGFGRLSPESDYHPQFRGGKGLLNYHIERYGNVAAIQAVSLDDDVILISSNGIIIRILANSIRQCQRPSKGVLLMRLAENSRVVTVACTEHDEEEEAEQAVDDGSAEEGSDGAETEEDAGQETADKPEQPEPNE
jgi:DNA gyrase subunit A